MTSLSTKLETIRIMADKQEQYSRRNCLLIYCSEKKSSRSSVNLVLQKINTELEIDLQIEDIDRAHRTGKYWKDNGGKTRPIIVKVVRDSDRTKVFNNKK